MLVGKEIGPFVLEKELGSGAMGTVYQALFRDTGERVALKIIAIGQLANETAVARFEREAKILKQLKHPNIVRLIASGRYKKTPFFAMELVEGESLDRVLNRRSNFSWEEVVDLGRQLCAALQHAHAKGIIHRDLKPSNVMVLPDGSIKLTDFGIAKDMDVTALTGANSTVGTAAYMSPEQCRGEKNLTAKSDLYSLGVMFYELLTGRKPYNAESPVDMFMLHVNGQFERPSRLVLTIPVWLDTLVCQLMEKKPDHRPFDAAMVAKALDEVEEKAIALKSAGVDAVTARRIDRPGARAEESDRNAARTLRGAIGRKKPRKKAAPINERLGLRAAGLISLLAALVAAVYFLTRPPSADKLYATAKAAVLAEDDDAVIAATQRFIDLYPMLDDSRAHEVQTWRKQSWTAKREKQLFNRFDRKLAPEDDGQKLSADALRYENEGDRENAIRIWQDMEAAFADSPPPEPAVYAWVAQKKRTDLERIDHKIEAMLETINEQRLGRPVERKPGSEAERGCYTALRFEQFGDGPAALARWTTVRDQFLKPPSVRPWGVMAADRVRRLKATDAGNVESERAFRLRLLQTKMATVDAINANSDAGEKQRAAAICRDIIELYSRDPDPQVAAFAPRAERKLLQLTS